MKLESLSEQKSTDHLKIYYFGCRQKDLSNEYRKYNCFWITLNFEYALMYSKSKDCTSFGSVYQIKFDLNKSKNEKYLNIFNINSDLDRKNLSNLLVKNRTYFKFLPKFPNLLKKNRQSDSVTDWITFFNNNEKLRDDLIEMLKSAGYDGIFNEELDSPMYRNFNFQRYDFLNVPSIGIFNLEKLKFSKIDLENFEKFQFLKEKDYKELKNDLYVAYKNNHQTINRNLYVKMYQKLIDQEDPKYLSLTAEDVFNFIDNFTDPESHQYSEIIEYARNHQGQVRLNGLTINWW